MTHVIDLAALADAARVAGLPPATVEGLAENYRLTRGIERDACSLAAAREQVSDLRRAYRTIRFGSELPVALEGVTGLCRSYPPLAAAPAALAAEADTELAAGMQRLEAKAAAAGFAHGGRDSIASLILRGMAKTRLVKEAAAALEESIPAASVQVEAVGCTGLSPASMKL